MSSAWRQPVFWLSILGLAILVLYLLDAILLPFVAGCAIAYFLNPLVDKLEFWGAPRGFAAFLVLSVFLSAVFLAFLVLVPFLHAEVFELITRIPQLLAAVQRGLNSLIGYFHERLSPQDFERLNTAVNAQLGEVFSWFGNLLRTMLTSSLALFNVLSLVFVTPVVVFFLLRDWNRMLAKIESLVPRHHLAVVREQADLVNQTLAGFIRGQAMVCLLMGLYYATALTLAGLDFGLFLGLLVGLLIAVPYLGGITGAIVALILAAAQDQSPSYFAVIGGIFVAGQALEGNLITPKLVGDRVNLHPVWLIFSLLAFGTLFGLVGLLVAVPTAAVVGVLVRFALNRYLQSELYDQRLSAQPVANATPFSNTMTASDERTAHL